MQKIQILFPDPQMKKLREIAKRQDRPISDIIRRATEAWMDRISDEYTAENQPAVPVFQGGKILTPSADLREKARGDRGLNEQS